MCDLINKILFYIKVFLLILAFSFASYICFIKMDTMSSNLLAILPIFIPFLTLVILFVFNMFYDKGNKNLGYNICCTLAFLAIIIVSLRTIFDQNIITYPSIVNLSYFNLYEVRIKVLLYLLILGNIMVLYQEKKNNKIHS